MTENHKKPRGGFWVTVGLLVIAVGYPLSLGPACWGTSRLEMNGAFVTIPYRPVIWAWQRGPLPMQRAIESYTYLCANQNWTWYEAYVFKGDGSVSLNSDGSPKRVVSWGPAP